MPATAAAMFHTARLARLMRSGMMEVLQQDYVLTARSKGLAEKTVLFQHALKNAAIPIVTILGLRVGHIVAGSIVTESVFAWPGVGRLLVNSVASRELAIVQAILIIVASSVVFINVLVDIIYSWVDPRIRTGGAEKE